MLSVIKEKDSRGELPVVWHQKTVCRQGGEPTFEKEGGKDWRVDGHLPVLADQGQISEGRGFQKSKHLKGRSVPPCK